MRRHFGWCWGPDEGGGAAGAGTSAPSVGASAPAAPAGGDQPAPSSAGTGGAAAVSGGQAAPSAGQSAGSGQAPGGAAQSAAAQAQAASVRDMLRQYGYDASSYQSDQAAMAAVALQLRQAQQYREQIQPQWSQFQAWQQQQAAAQQQAAQAQRKQWFEAPEYDPRWTEAIGYDATGQPYLKPGYAPDTIQKIQRWNEHLSNFHRNMARDPIGTLRPGLEEVVQEVASRLIQQQMGQYQEQQRAAQIISNNAPWMYQFDPQTKQPVIDPMTGRQAFSEWGNRYRQYVAEAVQMGIPDSMRQHNYAERSVMAEMAYARMNAQAAPGQAAAAGEAAKNQFIQQASRQPNASGAVPANGGSQPRKNLRERMMSDAQGAGINLAERVN